jgi:aspartate/methionine/tyrosine aminotransferase
MLATCSGRKEYPMVWNVTRHINQECRRLGQVRASEMKHPSSYLEWYVNVPKVNYDFRSSGTGYFRYNLNLGEVDMSANYAHGNPEATGQLARMYDVKPENVFISSEGASGQNARIMRVLAEKSGGKNEAIVEYPTYEPLLRQVQEYFPHVERLERNEKDGYRLDAEALRKIVTPKTGLLVLTNPHAPSGSISGRCEMHEIMATAREYGFYVVCDEIYAEFDRKTVPTLFSVDDELGIVTSSFTKAYGLGGLKLGVALASKRLVDEFYVDVLNTVGNSSNITQVVAAEVLRKGEEELKEHRQKWMLLKRETEEWLNEKDIEYSPSKVGITYWMKLPMKDTYKWTNERAIPHYSLALVPGAFFLFNSDYKLAETSMARLGLGNIDPRKPNLAKGLETLEEAMKA